MLMDGAGIPVHDGLRATFTMKDLWVHAEERPAFPGSTTFLSRTLLPPITPTALFHSFHGGESGNRALGPRTAIAYVHGSPYLAPRLNTGASRAPVLPCQYYAKELGQRLRRPTHNSCTGYARWCVISVRVSVLGGSIRCVPLMRRRKTGARESLAIRCARRSLSTTCFLAGCQGLRAGGGSDRGEREGCAK